MSIYAVRGVTVATVATADHAICALWNPDAGKRISVIELGIYKTAAGTGGDSLKAERITTEGTVGSTVTPDVDNAWRADKAPASAARLGLAAYSVQPTRATPALWGWVAANVIAAGTVWPCARGGEGIEIPPGAGLALTQRAATIWPISEVYFVWDE